MALGYFMSAFVPSGAGPQGALPVPPLQYFKLPSAGKNKLLRGSQGKGGRKNCGKKGRGGGQVGTDHLAPAFAQLHLFKKRHLSLTHPEKM